MIQVNFHLIETGNHNAFKFYIKTMVWKKCWYSKHNCYEIKTPYKQQHIKSIDRNKQIKSRGEETPFDLTVSLSLRSLLFSSEKNFLGQLRIECGLEFNQLCYQHNGSKVTGSHEVFCTVPIVVDNMRLTLPEGRAQLCEVEIYGGNYDFITYEHIISEIVKYYFGRY